MSKHWAYLDRYGILHLVEKRDTAIEYAANRLSIPPWASQVRGRDVSGLWARGHAPRDQRKAGDSCTGTSSVISETDVKTGGRETALFFRGGYQCNGIW